MDEFTQFCKDHNILRTNCSDLETLKRLQPVVERAKFPPEMYSLLDMGDGDGSHYENFVKAAESSAPFFSTLG